MVCHHFILKLITEGIKFVVLTSSYWTHKDCADIQSKFYYNKLIKTKLNKKGDFDDYQNSIKRNLT